MSSLSCNYCILVTLYCVTLFRVIAVNFNYRKTCGPYTSRILRLSKRNIAVTTKLFDEDKSSGTTDNEQTDFKANSDQSGDTVDKKEEAARKMRDLLLSMKKVSTSNLCFIFFSFRNIKI